MYPNNGYMGICANLFGENDHHVMCHDVYHTIFSI